MPKHNAKKFKSQVETELRKWTAQSRKMKTLSHISYGKIKVALMGMETCTPNDEMMSFRREIGSLI